jgi:transposase
MRWHRAFQRGGARALRPGQAGRPTKLTRKHVAQLQTALLQGPAAHGWSTDLWTLERVAALIRKRFDVDYHVGHVWKVLRAMGWSLQRPTTRARERDETQIAQWKAKEWPRLKKTPVKTSASFSSTKVGSPKAR